MRTAAFPFYTSYSTQIQINRIDCCVACSGALFRLHGNLFSVPFNARTCHCHCTRWCCVDKATHWQCTMVHEDDSSIWIHSNTKAYTLFTVQSPGRMHSRLDRYESASASCYSQSAGAWNRIPMPEIREKELFASVWHGSSQAKRKLYSPGFDWTQPRPPQCGWNHCGP